MKRIKRKTEVAIAIRKLRFALGHTQQSFATLLRLGIATIVRYESSRPPRGVELLQFHRLVFAELKKENDAEKKKVLLECATVLTTAINEEFGAEARAIPITIEEKLAVELLLTVMRNRHLVDVAETYTRVSHELEASLEAVGRAADAGVAVILADPKVRREMKELAGEYWAKREQK